MGLGLFGGDCCIIPIWIVMMSIAISLLLPQPKRKKEQPRAFEGEIHDVEMVPYAMSAEEIAAHAQKGIQETITKARLQEAIQWEREHHWMYRNRWEHWE